MTTAAPVIPPGWFTRWAGPAVITIAALGMLNWSWGTWPDPLVDFGAQLYVPWQLSTGPVLYRDLAYYNGPFSSYFNAAAFRIFGVGISTLVWTNLLILTVAMTLAYRLTVRASGRLSAFMAGLTFALVFAFGQVVRLGNYNWITPYTHEVTHGTVLGLAAIACVARFQRIHKSIWIAAAGGLLGAVFLTKAEPTAATFAAVTVQLIGGWWLERTAGRQIISSLAVLVGTSLILPISAWSLLTCAMPAPQALRGVLGSWPWVMDRRITALHFYRDVAGLDDIPGNLHTLLNWTGIYALLLGVGVGLGLLCRSPRSRNGVAIGAFAVCAAFIVWRYPYINWSGMLTPLPIVLALAFLHTAASVFRRTSAVAPLRLTLTVFATVLVAKLGLKAYAYHYGFVLAWPATAVLICAVTQDLPAWVNRRGGSGRVVKAIAIAAWLMAVWAMLRQDASHFDAEQSVIAAGTTDEFRGDQRALAVQEICRRINQLVPPTGTVIVLPQGLMINYLTRRASPTPYINFMPPEVLSAGEENILAALVHHPPDAIVLTPAVIAAGHFTLDDHDPYGADTLRWVMQNYIPADEAELKKPLIILLRKNQ